MERADVNITSEENTVSNPDIRLDREGKKIRIGIAGLAPASAVKYGKIFNEQNIFPEVEAQYLWTREEDDAVEIASDGKIPHRVRDPRQMLGKVNALILGHEYPEYFLDVAAPFLKERIPVFLQAPFCFRVEEGKEFLQLARQYGAPVTSYSPVAYSETTFSLRNQVKVLGKINQVTGFGPADLYAEHADIFDHVIHMIQSLMLIFGDDIEFVHVSASGKKGSANLIFKSGLFATLIFRKGSSGLQLFVETENDEFTEVMSYAKRSDTGIYYKDMVGMFRTGREPLSHKSILKWVAVLEALERSIHTQNWEEVRD